VTRLFASLASITLALFLATGSAVGSSPLPADQAFRLSVTKDTDGRLVLNWQIAGGYYLYRDHIEAKDGQGNALAVDTQPGQPKDDPNFGRLEVYYTHATASVKADAQPLELTYQGCQEDGICYRPETRTIDPVTLAISSEKGQKAKLLTQASAFAPASASAAPQGAAFALAPEKGMVEGLLDRGGTGLVIAAFLAFGVLLAFTPCVFPIYPILAGTLAREGEKLTASAASCFPPSMSSAWRWASPWLVQSQAGRGRTCKWCCNPDGQHWCWQESSRFWRSPCSACSRSSFPIHGSARFPRLQAPRASSGQVPSGRLRYSASRPC